MTAFRAQILTDRQRIVLKALGPLASRNGFYLAGGTAVALRLGHRRSADFDWFSNAPRTPPEEIGGQIVANGLSLVTDRIESGTLIGRVEGVRVSFFRFEYPLLEPLEPWSETGANIASLSDLACMKLLAVAQRGARKDFVDVYEMLRGGADLRILLNGFREKFSADTISVLRGLVYFDDAEAEEMPEMLVRMDWEKLKASLRDGVGRVLGSSDR